MTRKLLLALALLLLLVLAAAILVPLLVDKDTLLEVATTALHDQTGATLTVNGDVRLSVIPTLGIALSDAAITLPQKQKPDLRFGMLQIGVRLIPLFAGKLEIDSFVLDGLRARIESSTEQETADTGTLSDAELDAFYARRRSSMAESGSDVGAALIIPLTLRVRRLTITNAHLELIDPQGNAPTRIEIVQLNARDLNLDGSAIPLDAMVLLAGKQPIELGLNGDIRLDQQQQKATFNELKLALTGATAETFRISASGVIDLNRQTADLELALESGQLRGNGTVRYAGHESPLIDSTLQLNLLDPALLILAGPEAVTGAASGSEGTDEPLPLDALRTIDARTKLNIEQARFGAHTVKDLQVNLRALDGVVQVTDLTGNLHGGKLKASATFNGKHNTATLNTQGSLTRLDLTSALAATGSEPMLAGSATLSWQLQGRGRSADELTVALHGPIKLTTEDLVLQGTSIEKLLCQTVALTNKEQLTTTFSPNTRFELFTADIQVANGKATLKPLRAELTGISLSGSGNLDLLEQGFEATFKGRLSPELEQVDHACRVSKRLTAIDWPVNCVGKVGTEPGKWCKVDAAKILQDLTINEGREKLEKKAGKLFNKWFNKSD